ncbi:MAG: FAD-binding protein [Rhodospirillaceae bacterium]|nr:FAD-binding protein [Rhodospirillaceae bacterium]
MNERGVIPGLSREQVDLDPRSRDFGRMIERTPGAVARPKSVEDVSGIVRWAAKEDVRLSIRGGGHSQGGQSLTDGGLVVDTVWLGRVETAGPDLVRAQGGAQWGSIVDALRETSGLPRILVDTAEVSVGGTLSAGGFGTTSHRHGVQAGQVEQLEVVTGTGEKVLCSNSRNSGLFDAVRGGQGQFGIVTDAWIRLRKAGKRIRQYELRYRDFDRFANDFEQAVREDRFDHIRAETRVHDRDIVMSAGVEYDEDHDEGRTLSGLGYDEIVSAKDSADVGRAGMYPRWAFSRRMFHPWRDWFMPWEALRTVLAQPWLDPDRVPRTPDIWIGIYPIATQDIGAPLFMHPAGERMFSYSVLAVFDEFERANELAERLRRIDRTLIGLGGKAYLSGRVGYGPGEWREHYGDMLETAIRWKNEFDPNRVFGGEGMPFDGNPAASGGSVA